VIRTISVEQRYCTCNEGVVRLAEGRDHDADDIGESLRDIDTPELGRPKEFDCRLADKVGRDVDPPITSLIDTLGPVKAGATVEGTVSADEPEDGDRSTDGKVVERLKESYDDTPVGSDVI